MQHIPSKRLLSVGIAALTATMMLAATVAAETAPAAKPEQSAPKKAEPFFELQEKIFSRSRIPQVIVAKDGSVLAFTKSCTTCRRSTDGGKTWGEAFATGGAGNVVVDQTTSEVLIVRPRSGKLWRSKDHGQTWGEAETIKILSNAAGHGQPDGMRVIIHCSESGITLEHGKNKGRLIMPASIMPLNNSHDQTNWWWYYNMAIYSDDHGGTWQVSEPIQSGTGEGTLAELSDGRVFYNSRSHLCVDGRRQFSWSTNGGRYFTDWRAADDLFEVGQPFYFKYGSKPSYGCNAGMVRLPPSGTEGTLSSTDGKDVLLCSMPDDPCGDRIRMSVFASFDGGRSWPVKRLITGDGHCAYSSMSAGPDGTAYVNFEHKGSISLARFNLAWVMENAEVDGRRRAAEKAAKAKAKAAADAVVIARVRKEAFEKAKPTCEIQHLFGDSRNPAITRSKDGVLLAFFNCCTQYRRSTDSGKTWSDIMHPTKGAFGNLVPDDVTGEVLILGHNGTVCRTKDGGLTWGEIEQAPFRANPAGHGGSDRKTSKVGGSIDAMDTGITLEFGKYKGRLICPMRMQGPINGKDPQFWWWDYNTAVYSDDRGKTWQTGGPVQSGTGEGTVTQLSDGRVYYNSRSHMSTDNRRQIAWSHTGGEYFVDWRVEDDLRETGQPAYFRHCRTPSYGISAGLVRLPSSCTKEKDILLFSMPDDPGGHRRRMTVFASLDGGKTWPVKRLVDDSGAGYSSLTVGPDGMVHVLYETDHMNIKAARLNMAWLLERYDAPAGK